MLFHLKEKLITLGLPETQIGTVIDILRDEDIFRACNTEAFHTDHRRKMVFKKCFNYGMLIQRPSVLSELVRQRMLCTVYPCEEDNRVPISESINVGTV